MASHMARISKYFPINFEPLIANCRLASELDDRTSSYFNVIQNTFGRDVLSSIMRHDIPIFTQ